MGNDVFDELEHTLDAKRDERRISRAYSTADEIDHNLFQNLVTLLEQFKAGDVTPHDTLLQIASWTTEFLPSPLLHYEWSKTYREKNDDEAIKARKRQEIANERAEFYNGEVPRTVRSLQEGIYKYNQLRKVAKNWAGKEPPREPYWGNYIDDIFNKIKKDYSSFYERVVGQRTEYLYYHQFEELARKTPHLNEDERSALFSYIGFQKTAMSDAYNKQKKEYDKFQEVVGREVIAAGNEKSWHLTVDQLIDLYFEQQIETQYINIEYLQGEYRVEPEVLISSAAGIAGSGAYHTALVHCMDAYTKAGVEKDRFIEALAFRSAFSLFARHRRVEDQHARREQLARHAVVESYSRQHKDRRELEGHIRQVVLLRDAYPVQVDAEISALQKLAASGELDAWDLAKKIVALIVRPELAATRKVSSYKWGLASAFDEKSGARKKEASILAEMHEKIDKDRTYVQARYRSRDSELVLKAMKPQTEAEMRDALMRDFKKMRVEAFKEKYKKDSRAWIDEQMREGKRKLYSYHYAEAVFGNESYEYTEADRIYNDTAWSVPLDLPDKVLCDGIRIESSGTALICPYAPDPYADGWEEDVYGVDVARITTYSLTFKPKTPEDTKALAEALEVALKLLDKTTYSYPLPRDRSVRDGYARSATAYGKFDAADYAAQKLAYGFRLTPEGWIQPWGKLDLDDAFRLYYILEKILEPNAQIAAAYNAARYAEERGAVLKPHVRYADNQQHEVADPVGVLPQNGADSFAHALREAVVRVALRKDSPVDLLLQISTLAQATLSGTILDPSGRFPTYQRLLEEHREGNSGALTPVSPEEIFRERLTNLIAEVTGQSIDVAQSNPALAFKLAASGYGPMIRGVFRDRGRVAIEELREATRVYEREMKEKIEKDGWFGIEEADKEAAERKRAKKLSDIMSGRTPNDLDDEDLEPEERKLRERRIAAQSNIVVASRQVETQLDRVVFDSRGMRYAKDDNDPDATPIMSYRIKIRGSPFVRHELPAALDVFIKQRAADPHFHQHALSVVLALTAGPHP